MSDSSLKDKTIHGLGWSATDNIVQFAVTFVVSIVLARLLSPDDYGLLGLTAIITEICNVLISGGFGDALIRKKDASEEDYNTVFIVNLGMSLLLYLLIFVCAPYIAAFFRRQELIALTRVSSLGMVIGSLALVQRTRLTKRIDFKTQTKITFIASISSGVIGIVLAFTGFGVWALVTQSLSSILISTVFLWVFNKWIPRFNFSRSSFKYLFGYGWKIMAAGLLNTTWKELNQVIIGRFYGSTDLGQYTRARSFSGLFSSNLTSVLQRVTYPVLSDIQDNRERMIYAYRRIIKCTMFIVPVCMFFLGAISEPFIYCLIGPKWHDATIYLPLICIGGSLFPLQAINFNMLQVQGRSDIFLKLEIIQKIISLAPLFIGAFVGIVPMLCTSIITTFICYILVSHYSGKGLNYNTWLQFKDVSHGYEIAIVVALSVYFLKFIPISFWIILPMQIIVGAFVFFFLCKMTNLPEFVDLKEIVINLLSKYKKK